MDGVVIPAADHHRCLPPVGHHGSLCVNGPRGDDTLDSVKRDPGHVPEKAPGNKQKKHECYLKCHYVIATNPFLRLALL